MNTRFTLQKTGRFISADTIIPDPGSSQAYNRYAYVENRPIVMTDPTGHCSGRKGVNGCKVLGGQSTKLDTSIISKAVLKQQILSTTYDPNKDLIIGSPGADPVTIYGEFNVGPVHVSLPVNQEDGSFGAGSITIEGSLGGCLIACGIGNGTWDLTSPTGDPTGEGEVGVGLAVAAGGIEFGVARVTGYSTTGLIYEEIYFNAVIGVGDGVQFNPNAEAIVIRPMGLLADDLANGEGYAIDVLTSALFDGPNPLIDPNMVWVYLGQVRPSDLAPNHNPNINFNEITYNLNGIANHPDCANISRTFGDDRLAETCK